MIFRIWELFQSHFSRSFFGENITPYFHFFVPFLEVFLNGNVCVQLSTFPSFALWPSFRNFREIMWNKELHCSLSLLCAMGTCSKKYKTLDEIRTQTNSRTQISLYSRTVHWRYIHSLSVLKRKCRYSRVGSTVKKMLQIQSNTKAEGTKSRSKTYTPFPRFSFTRNYTTWTWTPTELD